MTLHTRSLNLLALLAAALALPAAGEVKNPDTFTYLAIGDADSLDPHWAYDAASHMAYLNIYETLFAYEGASTAKLLARAAEKVPSKANGLLSPDGKTYRIPIRKGMRFQDGTLLTPEDARYSLLRFLLIDRDAGPAANLLEPLLGLHSTRDAQGRVREGLFRDAAKAVSVEGDRLVLRLPKPFAPLLSILAQWAPIVSKAWAVKNGDWDGREETWVRHNNPRKEDTAFYQKTNGSGPFALERWDRKNKELILRRYEGYWRGPARLKRVVIKGVNEFGTRRLMLQAGDADSIVADRQFLNQLKGLEGVSLIDGLPTVEMDPVAYFTFRANPSGNPFIGSGRLDGSGIPPDFFSDKDARKAFAYAFDYAGYIRDVHRGRWTQASGCIPNTLIGHDPAPPAYTLDLGKAAGHLHKAWGGKAWEKGFKLTLAYNSGNTARETLCQILKRNIEGLNERFRIEVRPLEWPSLLDAYQASKLPLFVIGWQADFPDPHNFAMAMMHSQGDYPRTQRYSNPEADRLIEAAVAETDAAKRRALYLKLQAIERDDVPHILILETERYRTQ
ncbi:MAG: ABC transporter substrate-binding protein, partial [Elusimicrobiota bacterium]